MRLEHSELSVFHAVIEEGGFKLGAEKLHLTQSAVSQSIKGLETKIGTPLLVRSRPMKLTPLGRRLFKYAREQLQQEAALLDDIKLIMEGSEATLSLAIDSTNNRFHAPTLISEYCRHHPNSRLNVSEMPSRDIVQSVISGKTTLGFGPFHTLMNAFETFELYQERRLLMISPHHPKFDEFSNSEELSFESETLIASSLDDNQRPSDTNRLRDNFRNVWEVSSLQLRLSLIDQGLGLGYISELVLQQLPQYTHLRHLHERQFGTFERQVGIYVRADANLTSTDLSFIGICKDFFKQIGS